MMATSTVVYDLVLLRSDRGPGHAVKVSAIYEQKVGGEVFVGYIAKCGCGSATEIIDAQTPLEAITRGRTL